jgi:hypothetical protein
MAHIQITDRTPSELKPMEELTDGELLAINGGMRPVRPVKPIWLHKPIFPRP